MKRWRCGDSKRLSYKMGNKQGKQQEITVTGVGLVLAVLAFASPIIIRLPDYLLPGQLVPAACGQVVTGR